MHMCPQTLTCLIHAHMYIQTLAHTYLRTHTRLRTGMCAKKEAYWQRFRQYCVQ